EPAIVSVAAQDTSRHRRQRKRRDLDGRDEIEAPVELGFAHDRQRQRTRVGVRAAIRHESGSRPPVALDFELWLEASPTLRERTDDCPCECEIAGATSVAAPPESIHPPHGLCGQPYAGCERE